MNFGIKSRVNRMMLRIAKRVPLLRGTYNTPSRLTNTLRDGTKRFPVYEEQQRTETPPVMYNHPVSGRFAKYFSRTIRPAYVALLPNGSVYGAYTNLVLNADGALCEDLSREFGAYGGKKMDEASLIVRQWRMEEAAALPGNVAVLSTEGTDNFHHWLYDTLPRIHLLREAGLLDQMDRFLLSYKKLPFQVQTLQLLGFPVEKIVNPIETGIRHYRAESLYVPSLPSPLGTVSPWVVRFLHGLVMPPAQAGAKGQPLICISRKGVGNRMIKNEAGFKDLLRKYDIVEVLPEDYSLQGFARVVGDAKFIISIHGSGLSNLCFASPGATVIDILMPYHQDAYYWLISNIREAKYVGFFSEGEHPDDGLDLVRRKYDHDVVLDLPSLDALLQRETQALQAVSAG